jgi:hypothetical protein
MATNGSYRRAGRIGNVREDAHVRDPRTGQWTTRDTKSGRFRLAKRLGGSLRSVRRED